MREFQQKQRIKNILYSKLALVLFAIFIIWLASGTLDVWEKERESARIVADLEEKRGEVTEREGELRKSIELLSTEEGVRAELRDKFNVSGEGEQFVVIVDPKPSTDEGLGEEQGFLNGVTAFIKGLWPW